MESISTVQKDIDGQFAAFSLKGKGDQTMINKVIEIWNEPVKSDDDGFNSAFRPALTTYILDGNTGFRHHTAFGSMKNTSKNDNWASIENRPAVLVLPGGGYSYTSAREAEPIALRFIDAGYHTFVLDYSVAPAKHPQPLLDASRAMCIIRNHAEEWGICPDKIAVCGFSAGGHLAASLGVHWDKEYLEHTDGIEIGKNRPDALILCYPVITSGEFAHRGSFISLLGENPGSDLLYEMSLEHHVSEKTPPAFLWHTFSDGAVPVENSLLFAQALREKNIPFELHIYPEGPHGLSLATEETAVKRASHISPHIAGWTKLCTDWLKQLFG